ncbi:MAG: 50S ribosomal protein L15 [Anaerolineae bacterium]
MKLHDIKPAEGSVTKKKRVGRGLGSGQGTYAGRGKKGQHARSGGTKAPYHQGGNLPLVRKLPFVRGVGFTSRNKIHYAPVNVDDLNEFTAGAEINPMALTEAGLIHSAGTPVVVLGRGEVSKALTVKAHRISETARQKIEAAGGSIEILPL